MSQTTLSVVILTRKRPDHLKRCLDSLLSQNGNIEVFVVGNDDDEETATLMKQYATVNYLSVQNSVNILAARNLGAEKATGDFVAFIDDDVTLYPGWTEACVNAFGDSSVGVVGGRIIDPLTENTDFSQQEPICKILPDGRYTGNQELDPGQVIEVDHLQGCNWAMRKDAFFKVGGFDPTWGYNLYEEMDLGLRLRKAGYRMLFVPGMFVYHHMAPSKNRLPKTFRIRFRNVRSLTRAYARSLGIGPGSVTFSYLLRGDTGWRALARQPSLKMILYVISGYFGKIAGLLQASADGCRRNSR